MEAFLMALWILLVFMLILLRLVKLRIFLTIAGLIEKGDWCVREGYFVYES
jgi:hypothetical protein